MQKFWETILNIWPWILLVGGGLFSLIGYIEKLLQLKKLKNELAKGGLEVQKLTHDVARLQKEEEEARRLVKLATREEIERYSIVPGEEPGDYSTDVHGPRGSPQWSEKVKRYFQPGVLLIVGVTSVGITSQETYLVVFILLAISLSLLINYLHELENKLGEVDDEGYFLKSKRTDLAYMVDMWREGVRWDTLTPEERKREESLKEFRKSRRR